MDTSLYVACDVMDNSSTGRHSDRDLNRSMVKRLQQYCAPVSSEIISTGAVFFLAVLMEEV